MSISIGGNNVTTLLHIKPLQNKSTWSFSEDILSRRQRPVNQWKTGQSDPSGPSGICNFWITTESVKRICNKCFWLGKDEELSVKTVCWSNNLHKCSYGIVAPRCRFLPGSCFLDTFLIGGIFLVFVTQTYSKSWLLLPLGSFPVWLVLFFCGIMVVGVILLLQNLFPGFI